MRHRVRIFEPASPAFIQPYTSGRQPVPDMVSGPSPVTGTGLLRTLESFRGPGGETTLAEDTVFGDCRTRRFTNEFWTSRQRQAAAIHEVSYRACFKPQLPRFFIDHL